MMDFLEIISVVVFPISLGSFQLAVEQGRIPLFDRVGMFRSEDFVSIVFFPSLVLMIASGIVLLLYSWILLLCFFIGTAISFPLFGRSLLIRLWYIPHAILDRLAKKKLGDDQQVLLHQMGNNCSCVDCLTIQCNHRRTDLLPARSLAPGYAH